MNFNLWPPSNLSKIVTPGGVKTGYFFNWLNTLYMLLKQTIGVGYSGTVTVTKLTGGGTNGMLTFTNGVLTKVVQPT